MDGNVDEFMWRGRGVDRFQQHRALVLIEEFGGRVDVVVSAGVGTAHDHDGEAGGERGGGGVDAVVVSWGLEEVGVLFEPGRVNAGWYL